MSVFGLSTVNGEEKGKGDDKMMEFCVRREYRNVIRGDQRTVSPDTGEVIKWNDIIGKRIIDIVTLEDACNDNQKLIFVLED
jgi:hypothetical protein